MDTALTFDDVLLMLAHSAVLPKDASTRTRLRDEFLLAAPVISAVMDAVTESEMAIALTLEAKTRRPKQQEFAGTLERLDKFGG